MIGVDGSASMIAAARERLGPGPELSVADLLELEVAEPADAILSTATFHWIADHERLFARLRACLRERRAAPRAMRWGGEHRRAAPPGDARSCAREPFAEHLERFHPPWNYAAPRRDARAAAGRPASRARSAGSRRRPQQPEHPREFLETIVLRPHVQRSRQELRERFMDEVLEELGEPVVVDYVRLNIDARA